jgi:hypothetical protein
MALGRRRAGAVAFSGPEPAKIVFLDMVASQPLLSRCKYASRVKTFFLEKKRRFHFFGCKMSGCKQGANW